MNGVRCAIRCNPITQTRPLYLKHWTYLANKLYQSHGFVTRIFGSRSEAKRELRHLIDAYPHARIVDEVDL